MKLPQLSRWCTPALLLLLAAAGLVAWMDTWLDYVKQPGTGEFSVAVLKANVVVGALAVLAFALGVEWLTRRAWLRGALALAPLPVLALPLGLVETWVGNQVWIAIYIAPLSGLLPFGSP